MNKHILLDNITASIGALISGKKKFFAGNLNSLSFEEHVAAIQLKFPQITGEGIYEVSSETLVGRLDPAFRIAQWKGMDFPTIIYHHGNNERPFDFNKSAKNTFYSIFINTQDRVDANLIVARSPFHNSSLKNYQEKMLDLSNFMAMIATSVRLNEEIINELKRGTIKPIITSGISLGGWISNLHHGIYNTSTVYAPLLAGAFLGELFLTSKYRKMTSDHALKNPVIIRRLLNFDGLFKRHNTQNVFPLLSKFDQFIEYDVQKETYKGYSLKTIDCGHITGALNKNELRGHLLSVLELTDCQKS